MAENYDTFLPTHKSVRTRILAFMWHVGEWKHILTCTECFKRNLPCSARKFLWLNYIRKYNQLYPNILIVYQKVDIYGYNVESTLKIKSCYAFIDDEILIKTRKNL